jgi:thiol-disulfide isomerase/thioredoxin
MLAVLVEPIPRRRITCQTRMRLARAPLAVGMLSMVAACATAPPRPEVKHLLTGQVFPLEAFRGHVMVVNLWADWCKPCLAEVPELAKIADQYGEKVVFVALYYQPESMAGVQVMNWLRLQPDYFAHYVAWGNSSLLALFPQRGLPTTYVVGTGGAVVQKFVGSITSDERLKQLRTAIDAGLQQRTSAATVTR